MNTEAGLAYFADQIRVTSAAGPDRRAALFRESARDRLERWALGFAWAASPKRLPGLPALARVFVADLARAGDTLPDPEAALDRPYGLAGIARDLSMPRLLAAHRRGLYPFAHVGPAKWWSPPKRSLLFFSQTHIAKRLRRQMRQGHYRVTFDTDFDGVIKACAGQRAGRWHVTWITPSIMRAYAALFDAGYAHSFEVWNDKGELAGGGYGVALGNSFVTESQFSREDNTSKIGFTSLNYHLAHWGFAFNDGKILTPTTRDMSFREIARADYLTRLASALEQPDRRGRWQVEFDLAQVADWQPQQG
ncbi:MAG: leucyl/phenylalanyl-tRNA--protein transferase [Pseudolabrys sp.]|nr:leucyl/phenylalanyl-tRNA--protein transferase [Pseudolabrys sp.]